jgi:hypothetical protein
MWPLSKIQLLVEYLKWPMSKQKEMVLDTLLWSSPSNLWGAMDLGIQLNTFLDIPLGVDAPMGLGMVFVNTNDYGKHTQH